MAVVRHLTLAELEAGLEEVRRSPKDVGEIKLIVRRPAVDAREELQEAELSADVGLVGDTWAVRESSRSKDGSAHPHMQLNIMNARAVALIAQERERWALAGDQLYLDLDLSGANLPAWTNLRVGSAIIEITDQPHTGCQKFVARFGRDAMRLVNSPVGRELNLRGVNARVLQGGAIRMGDPVWKVAN